MNNNQFERYKDTINALDLAGCTTWPDALKMRSEGQWAAYYAPFDFVNPTARLVLVGITPGLTQALNALRAAQSSLRSGETSLDALRHAKTFASFSGAMRTNLIAMLDHIGLPRVLGIATTAHLFGSHDHLVHFTSALRYPVTLRGENYGGTPGILSQSFTRGEVNWFAEEATALRAATFVPLGPAATEAVEHLQHQRILKPDQILPGLPHPSGANAERIAYFLRRKSRDALSAKVNAKKLDANRSELLQRVAGLG